MFIRASVRKLYNRIAPIVHSFVTPNTLLILLSLLCYIVFATEYIIVIHCDILVQITPSARYYSSTDIPSSPRLLIQASPDVLN
jgi:hypothetical protein